MKVYISGKISGLPMDEVKAKFNNQARILCESGYMPVNPLNNGLTEQNTWEEHMLKDLELLFGCDAIYMLEDWQQSVGASLEFDVAKRLKKIILGKNI